MKKIIYSLVIVIAVFWLFSATKDNLARWLIEKAAMQAAGLKFEIQDLRLGIWRTEIEIKSLRIFSPAQYKDSLILDIPYLFIDYDFAQLLKKKIFIEKMQLILKEIILVRDAKGRLNLANFILASHDKSLSNKIPIEIKHLNLKIGRLLYKDYSKDNNNPLLQEFNLNLEANYSDVSDLNSLMKKVVSEILFARILDKLPDLDSGIKNIFSGKIPE